MLGVADQLDRLEELLLSAQEGRVPLGPDQFALLFSTEDALEGMNAFGEKRKPKFEGR